MPTAHGVEIRQRAIELSNNGWTGKRIEEALGVSDRTVRRWKGIQKERGSLEPLPVGGSESKIDDFGLEILTSIMAQNCSTTLDEMKEALADCADLDVGRSSVDRALHRMDISFKKKTYRAMGDDADRLEAQRADFEGKLLETDLNQAIFFDEFAVNLMMDSPYGRAPVGERAVAKRPIRAGKKKTKRRLCS